MMTRTAFSWTDSAVRRALGLDAGSRFGSDAEAGSYASVSTDTRSMEPGSLFVALQGDNFDGHDYLAAAAEAGAAGAVVSRDVDGPAGLEIYRVPDTLVALGQLARFRRDALDIPVVALTGSSGKTTTKDFLRAALSPRYRVHATAGNLNNRIGVPLTILATPDDAEVLVVEMGTSEPGEIRALAEIGHPDIALVLTVGESHLEKLGSIQGVLEEKVDLIRGLREGGTALVGDQPTLLPDRARELIPSVLVAGLSSEANEDLRPTHLSVDAQGRYAFRWQDGQVELQVAGRHMAYNAVLALAVSSLLDVDPEAACAAISRVSPSGMRGEVRELDGWTVLVDCYNANPQSTRAALDTLAAWSGQGSRVAILGSMLELGTREAELHDEVLEYALSLELDAVVATGHFAVAAEGQGGEGLVREEDPEAGLAAILPRLGDNAVVLLKASRGVRMERLIPELEAAAAENSDHVDEAAADTDGAVWEDEG